MSKSNLDTDDVNFSRFDVYSKRVYEWLYLTRVIAWSLDIDTTYDALIDSAFLI